MFCEAGSDMVANQYSKKSHNPSEGALFYFILIFLSVVGFRARWRKQQSKQNMILYVLVYFLDVWDISSMCRISQNHFFRTLGSFCFFFPESKLITIW